MILSPLRQLATRLRMPASPPNDGELLESLRLIIGLDQLISHFAAGLREISGARTLYIVQQEPITGRYSGRRACGDHASLLDRLAFLPSDRLIRWLATNRDVLDGVRQPDIMGFLTPGERDRLVACGIELVIPLATPSRLTGIVLLSARSDGRPYGHHLIDTLVRICREASLAIEHAVMYELQQDRLKRIFHADKLATVGELAARAAHEIRNPLTFIRSSVQFMRSKVPGEIQDLIDGVIRESDRIDKILKDLLSLSRSSGLELEAVDLGDLVARTVSVIEPELRSRNITLLQDSPSGTYSIRGDPSQLEQVMLNLSMNSIQAMPEGGTLSIGLSAGGDHQAGRTVEITVSDTGIGIRADVRDRVFDPFYTTKEGGTGLGLSICYGIVARHGGEIDIQSTPEGPSSGTTVTIRLPADAQTGGHR